MNQFFFPQVLLNRWQTKISEAQLIEKKKEREKVLLSEKEISKAHSLSRLESKIDILKNKEVEEPSHNCKFQKRDI